MPATPQSLNSQQAISAKGIWALFFGSLSLIPISMALGIFDTTTELIPTHVGIETSCFVVAAVFGLLACGAGIYFSRYLNNRQRVVLPLVIMLETAIGVFMVADHSASIVEGWVDFPANRTHTRQVPIQISRAYQTHGRGSSQYIQTMPVWSNLEITPEDFAFMRDNRRLGDDGHSPDEVSSHGYFCANVVIEQSDHAIRILHAGSHELPKGTVIRCPVPNRAR